METKIANFIEYLEGLKKLENLEDHDRDHIECELEHELDHLKHHIEHITNKKK